MKTKALLLMFVTMLVLGSCRTDGGDIGLLYGEWALQSYTIDGEEAGIYVEDYFWRFQGSVIYITQLLPYHDFVNTLGSWTQEAMVLKLDFTHTYIKEDGEVYEFDPPEELGIPAREVTEMVIERLTSCDLVLSFTDSKGKVREYRLKKLN